MTKPVAEFTLDDLQRVEIRENARYAWDSNFNVVVLAPEVAEIDRIPVEQWLINHSVPYAALLIGNQCVK